jgi:ribosome recycling factor
MIKESLADAEHRMKGAIHALEEDLNGIRTGRAAPALIEKLMVEYYGTPTQLQQLATIGAPEPQLLTIRPFDPSSIGAIEKAIRTSELGLNPANDGKLIRLAIPPLNEERRSDLVKIVHKRLEDAKVAVRNVRRDTLDDVREFEKEKMISEDDAFRGKEDLEKLTTRFVEQIDEVGRRKEQEIKEV